MKEHWQAPRETQEIPVESSPPCKYCPRSLVKLDFKEEHGEPSPSQQLAEFSAGVVGTSDLSNPCPRRRPSSTMSCWPTCTRRRTRAASWKSRLTRPSGGTTCCACTTRSRRRSTSLGTSAPALCPLPCPHPLMTPGSRTPAATGP